MKAGPGKEPTDIFYWNQIRAIIEPEYLKHCCYPVTKLRNTKGHKVKFKGRDINPPGNQIGLADLFFIRSYIISDFVWVDKYMSNGYYGS